MKEDLIEKIREMTPEELRQFITAAAQVLNPPADSGR